MDMDRYAVLALLACGFSSFASGQAVSFEKVVDAPIFSIEGMATAAQLAPDQGACVFASNALIGSLGDAEILLLRVNGEGTIVQDLVIGDMGGQGYHDVATEVVQANKHYYVTGYTRAIDTSATHTFTSFLIKVDTALNFIWQRNYILPGQEIFAEAMTVDGQAHLLVAGKIYDGTDFQPFVMQVDTGGTLQWIERITMPHGTTVECIRRMPGGAILLSGSMVFGFELVLPFVCKLDADGDAIWGRYYNYPPGFVERSNFQFLHVRSVDQILLAGFTDKFGAGATDLYMVSIDSSGAVNGAWTYGGPQFDETNMVQFDAPADELVMVGGSGSFASSGASYPMAVRVAPSGLFIGGALYGDTSVYQPGRFHHSARVSAERRLLMGSRDFPEDDLYLVGADNDLANTCAYHPITPTVMPQACGTSSFTFTMTYPTPVVNDMALGLGTFSDGSWLCANTVSVGEEDGSANGFNVWVTDHGSLVWQLPVGMEKGSFTLLDALGRETLTWRADEEVSIAHMPAAGLYHVRCVAPSGRTCTATLLLK